MPSAVTVVESQTSPEVEYAVVACQAMGQHLADLAGAYRALGNACSQYADALDRAHHEVLAELESLVAWTAGLQIGGAVLAFVTAGLSEAAAQAAEAARIALAATRIGNILRDLGDTMLPLTTMVSSISTRAGDILGKLGPLLSRVRSVIRPNSVAAIGTVAKEEVAIEELANVASHSRTID